jgi:phosphonate transport system permease protein
MAVDAERAALSPSPSREGTAGLPRVWHFLIGLATIVVIGQSLIVVQARPQDLVTGIGGMADFLRRSFPPDFSQLDQMIWPTLETVDIAIFGTIAGILMALPMAILGAENVSPSRPLYFLARAIIGFTRAVPDLVWALLFVTAVGLGPFPGGLALAVHSIGMLGRLFSEQIENMEMGPIDALTLTGASRLQIFTHGVVPSVLPALLGISLYRLDENIRSSLVLGFVGAGGLGFRLLTAMNLFQYREVSTLLIITFILVISAERVSAVLRARLH